MPWVSDLYIASGGKRDYAAQGPLFDPSINTHYSWVGDATSSGPAGTSTPQATPVAPQFDPKLEANALYGKPMALYTGGYARMGASPAPIVGPYFNGDIVEFVVSFGVPSNPEGDRKIYNIWLDNELAWSSPGGGTLPGDGTFASQAFDFIFKPGTLTQSVVSLETEKFPGDECAYRPQMILQIRNLPWQRFMDNTGKPVPYVAVEIGDVTDGADPLDGINLGEALERIAFSPWAGYTSSSFDAVNVTDVVDAILIKDNFTIIQLCQSVTGEYRNLDLVLSDKVRIKDRGSSVTPDFIFDRNSIIAGDEPLSVSRANATAQRREHELIAIDPDQDYTAVPSLAKIPRDPMIISAAVGKETATIPLVIDANTRQALATFSQNYDENARRKVALKVPVVGYEIEPGDLFALSSIANGFDNEVWKCTQTSHGANWVVEIEAEAILRCSIYGESTADPYLSYTVLLIDHDGADGSAIFTDQSPLAAGDAVLHNDPQHDTSVLPPYGTSSYLFADAGDALNFADRSEYYFGSLPFTLDFTVRHTSITGRQTWMGQWAIGGLSWLFQQTDGVVEFLVSTTGSDIITVISGGSLVINVWSRWRLDYDGTKYRLYKDGAMVASVTASYLPHDVNTNLVIGTVSFGTSYALQAYCRGIRVTVGAARTASDGGYSIVNEPFPIA